jgi:lipid-binding SYLF domain-containing protein
MIRPRNAFAALLLAGFIAGCQTEPSSEAQKDLLSTDADAALKRMYVTDSSLKPFIDQSAGYAVFPSVGKGGLIVGASYGRGVVYQGGAAIGYADITQGTVGLQAGGQEFAQVVVFQDQAALDRFKTGKLKFAANASAVALKAGAGTTAKYTDGVAIFVEPKSGLMAEAAVGGQQFTYVAK